MMRPRRSWRALRSSRKPADIARIRSSAGSGGDILAQRDPAAAEAVYREALPIAQTQGARTYELQAAHGLAALLNLREPSVLTVKGLRRVLQLSGGVSSRIFRMLNDLAIQAIETGEERITDMAVETYKPISENEVAFQ